MTAQLCEFLRLDAEELVLDTCPPLPERHAGIIEIDRSEVVKNGNGIFVSTACWRGYQGVWEIRDGRLFLSELRGSFGLRDDKPILADWFSGVLRAVGSTRWRESHGSRVTRIGHEVEIAIEKGAIAEMKSRKYPCSELVDVIEDLIERQKPKKAPSRVYSSTFEEFSKKILTSELYSDLARSYVSVVGHTAGTREINSWEVSLPRLDAAMRLAGLPLDVQVILEQKLPHYAKRIDATLLGRDLQGKANAVIVELKAWTTATADGAGNLRTALGGAMVSVPHPSQQVGGYHDHLLDFFRCFHGASPIQLSSCAYCHNYQADGADNGVFHPQFDEARTRSPVFGQDDIDEFASFLRERLICGNGDSIQKKMDDSGIGPSERLIDHAGEVIRRQDVFRLLDDQLVANNAIQAAFNDALNQNGKRVIVVRGGPGTGKSVIAINTLGAALKQQLDVSLVTGSAAFTYGIRKVFGDRLSGFVRFTDSFWDATENSKDVLIIDEGHRIRAKSAPRVSADKRPTVSQADELIRTAKISVVFLDENQIISPDEVGDPQVFREACNRLGIHLSEYQLKSQFRCDGSDAYLAWLDDLLELGLESQGLKLKVPEEFDIKIVDTPHQLVEEIEAKNKLSPNSARLVAGWCWPWSDPLPEGLIKDIVIGDFRFCWEAKNGKKPPKGVPEAKFWAVDPAGAGQAGTVYSMQGFEMNHIGVIIGPDLVVRNGDWVAQPKMNYSNRLRAKNPGIALPYFKRIYRTLLSRAMHSCSVYCIDDETKAFIASRLIG